MKADKMHRITIPGIYLKRIPINIQDKIQIVKGIGYGKFYITDGKQEDLTRWNALCYVECRNKIKLPREIYSETSEYSFGIDKGGIYILKTA